MTDLPFHPLANIFPLMDGEDFAALVEDVRANGVHEPVVLLDGQILDGRNRYRAAKSAGIDCPLVAFGGPDPVGFVISLNLRRRHLDESQRAMVAAKLANLNNGQKASQICEAVSRDGAAKLLNVSPRSVDSARVVTNKAVPELAGKVERGEVSVSAAADVARLSAPEQQEIVARGEAEILDAAKRIRAAKAEERRAELVTVAAKAAPIPAGRFGTIVVDPPWPMAKIERDVRPNQVEFDYPTMTEEELADFGATISEFAADNCHMFMWTTHRFLPMALRLLDRWGFRYVLTMVWHKPGGFQPIGLPQYNCEFTVYARRGTPSFRDTKAFPCCFEAPRREHSRKPDEFYDLIRRVTAGPRIDVFSREAREGFEQFGKETELFARDVA